MLKELSKEQVDLLIKIKEAAKEAINCPFERDTKFYWDLELKLENLIKEYEDKSNGV